jgi:hypothetical protein
VSNVKTAAFASVWPSFGPIFVMLDFDLVFFYFKGWKNMMKIKLLVNFSHFKIYFLI